MLAVRGSLRRRSRLSHPAVHGSLRRRLRLSHPAVRGSLRRRSRLSHPAVRGSWRRRSRLSHPAVRGSSRRRSRINQPTVHRRWRHHPRLTLAHRPATDSMPAGLPLTQCPPACRWLNARRPAADSSSPDCRWLKFAGLPLTHARWSSLAGKANSLPLFTPPCAAHRPRRSREITPPAMGKANPPSAAASSSRGKPTRRPRFTRPAAGWGSLQPAGPCRIWQASRPWPHLTRLWPRSFYCFCVFSPGGLLIPLSFPKEILGGGSRAPAEETEVGAGATVSEAVPPWPPELPAPPWPPELPAPPGPLSVCSTLEAPSCVCICVGPVGSPECPPPLPGSTVTARDVPSGRGELC